MSEKRKSLKTNHPSRWAPICSCESRLRGGFRSVCELEGGPRERDRGMVSTTLRIRGRTTPVGTGELRRVPSGQKIVGPNSRRFADYLVTAFWLRMLGGDPRESEKGERSFETKERIAQGLEGPAEERGKICLFLETGGSLYLACGRYKLTTPIRGNIYICGGPAWGASSLTFVVRGTRLRAHRSDRVFQGFSGGGEDDR